MQSGWSHGRNVTGYRNKILAVIITVTIFCTGCSRNVLDNSHTADTGQQGAVTEHVAEENTSEDIKDRENTGAPRQYIWGTWKVTAAWDSETGWEREYCRLLGSAYRLRPDRLYATGRQTDSFPVRYDWAFSAELDGIYGSIVSTDYLKESYEIRTLDADYCLRIRTEWEECTSYGEWRLFSFLYLTGEKEMVGVYDGTAYLLEKTKDYDGTGTVIPESGTICGEWEVTDVQEAGTADAGREKGQRLSIAAGDLEPETFGKFYSAGTGDVPDGGFAEKAGLEPGDFSAVCEFTNGFGWDRIVLKDRITAVLEKDGKFYRAEKTGEDGGYSPADMDGWEYTGEKRLPVWGTWKVTGHMSPNGTAYSGGDKMGDTYQILPDKITYKEKNCTGSAELKKVRCSVVSPEYVVEIYGSGGWKGNCILSIYIDASETEVISGDKAPYLDLYMEEENKMVLKIARCSYLLERTGDYDGTGDSTVCEERYGFFSGIWEITEALRSHGEDRPSLIGEYLSTENEKGIKIGEENIRDFYAAARENKSVRKLVDAVGIKDDPLLYIYEFKEDFFWDKMILKDENTVVLEKDGDFYWAERKGSAGYRI